MAPMKRLRLRRHEDRRIRAGHLWVFSNEVDTAATPLKAFEPGELANLEDSSGAVLGTVYVNPDSLICARLISRGRGVRPDARWLARRLERAMALRRSLYPDSAHWRWVHGEGDGLPGLVVDRYGDFLSVQVTTAGMERLRAEIAEALRMCVRPAGIVWRDDAPARRLEGLPDGVVVEGEVPERVPVVEGRLQWAVDLRGGQKTGWYYDQRDNRARFGRYARGRSVLDLYSHAGAWALQAVAAGASAAMAVDSSADAIACARQAAQAAGLDCELVQDKVEVALARLAQEGRRFGVCVVDPPALIRRRKDRAAGRRAYLRVNRMAIEVLEQDAFLVSCSCSHHLSTDDLRGVLQQAASEAGRRLQILEFGGQGADHPVHPAMPETRYLDALFCRVIGG